MYIVYWFKSSIRDTQNETRRLNVHVLLLSYTLKLFKYVSQKVISLQIDYKAVYGNHRYRLNGYRNESLVFLYIDKYK